jgi:hypothetical protein
MYLPLDYYEILTSSDDARGPRGGVILSYESVHRRLGNDLFVGLVRGAGLGHVGPRRAS